MALHTEHEPRRLLWPSTFAMLALGLLLGLGTWQIERKAWKEDLIAKIQVRSHAETMVLDAATMLFKSGADIEYSRVRARGRPLNDHALFYFANEREGPGFHVYVPLQTPNGDVLLVNRGFIGQPQRAAFVAAARRAAQAGPADEVDIIGLLRQPGRKVSFTPDNEIENNLWYWRDLAGMAKAIGAPANAVVLPYFLEEAASPASQPAQQAAQSQSRSQSNPLIPRPGVTRIDLPNRHLEYALTWYGLAAALIIVYLLYATNRQRSMRDRRLLGAARRRSWGKP